MKYVVRIFSITFFALFLFVSNAYATADYDYFDIDASKFEELDGSTYGLTENKNTLSFYYKYITDANGKKLPVFSKNFTSDKKFNISGDYSIVSTNNGEVSGNLGVQYGYLLNSFNDKIKELKEADKQKEEYFITQIAISCLTMDCTYGNKPINERIKKLVTSAKSISSNSISATIDDNDIKFSLSNDRNYFVSNEINVSITGSSSNTKYSVKLNDLPDGSLVTDLNYDIKTNNTFDSGEKFLIRIPVSKVSVPSSTNFSFTITVITDDYYGAYEYRNNNLDYALIMGPSVKKGISVTKKYSLLANSNTDVVAKIGENIQLNNNDNNNNSNTNNNVNNSSQELDNNAQTGSILSYVVWTFVLLSAGYTVYYYKNGFYDEIKEDF